MSKVKTFLWFKDRAEEAANFYVSLFQNSRVTGVRRLDGPTGPVVTAEFELDGQEFVILDGGPHFQLSPAVSLTVDCKDQREVDELWERLTEGGEESRCGWLVDRYGLSWQLVPAGLVEMLSDPDREKAGRAMEAMLTMGKLDIGVIRRAFQGGEGSPSAPEPR